MKICPKCGTTYQDETLNFCLEDGSVLNRQEGSASEPPPTVMMQEVSPTVDQAQTPVTSPQESPQAYVPQYTMPRKRSRTWIWVVLALFAVVTVCGGGIVGLIALGSLDDGSEPPPSVADSKRTAPPAKNLEDRDRRTRIDFSDWPAALSGFRDIKADYDRGELVLSTRKNYFYVIFTKPEFSTTNANARLTAKNLRGRRTSYGYGMLVHADPMVAMKRDYAFLIDSVRRRYKIVDHVDKKESIVVDWTSSDSIKSGTAENDLEVRADGDEMHFYINGDFVRTVKDYLTDGKGVAGLYFSDDVPIAFSNFELAR